MSKSARLRRPTLLRALVVAGLVWGGWKWTEVRHYQKAIARVEDEIERGLVSRAASDLAELIAAYPGADEAAFLLGQCEKARGRPEAAAEAWTKVPLNSTFAFRAIEGLMELKLEQGRLSEAEQLILRTRDDPRYAGPDVSILLGAIYSQEGRLREALLLIEALWQRHDESGQAASETAIKQLWLYIELQSNRVPDETVRAILEQAGQVAPNDDRIWLWKADLAIRTRSYDQAAKWLDLCQQKRPEDPFVWRARLDWAVATGRAATAREVLKHLPAAESGSMHVEKLVAWFAAQRGDDEAEQKSLERLTASDPTDFVALDRLADLCRKHNQPRVADALRQRKDEVRRLQARYDKLFKRRQPRRDAAEMARIAEQLGHRFEARAFLTIALASARDPAAIRRDLARFSQNTDTSTSSARTLAEVLAPQLRINLADQAKIASIPGGPASRPAEASSGPGGAFPPK